MVLAIGLVLPAAGYAATPVPFISQPPVPASVAPGTSFTLSLNGTGFASTATINWTFLSGGTSTPGSFSPTCTSTNCSVVVPSGQFATPGTVVLTVVNPGTPALTSNFVLLPVANPATGLSVSNTDYAVGNTPQAIVAADFNGDGLLDLAVANNSDSTITILLGKADGTFAAQPTVSLTALAEPKSLAVGDFNNDGKMDLAVAESNLNQVGVLLGKGDGTFQAEVDFSTGNNPLWVATGDFNGDGKLDLAVANKGSDSVSVLLGDGTGHFGAKKDYSTGTGTGPSSVAIGDLRLAGKLDLVVADNANRQVSVLLGKGDGTFQTHVNYAVNKTPTCVVVATFDETNHNIPDVVVVDSGSGQISYLRGVGDGTLKPAVPFVTGAGPFQAVVGDFNADGHLDLAVTDTTANAVSVLFGNGDGTFKAPSNFARNGSPVGIAAGDFNGDGYLDFAIADSASKTASVEFQSPTATLQPTSLSFGNQNVGQTSAAQTVALTNSGSATLNIQSIAITGTNSGDFAVVTSSTNPCGTTLASGASCNISVTFSPTSPGPRAAQLSITDNAPSSPQTVSLSGTGISTTGPFAYVSPSSLTFSTQGVGTTSPSQPVTLTNYGSAPLTITSITFGGANPGDFGQTNNCGALPAMVAAGANCTISVTFAPAATGTRSATLTVTDNSNGTAGSMQSVSLTGTGINPSVVPVPQIDQPLVPNTVAPGSAAFTLTINGAGFFTNATVNWTPVNSTTTTPLPPTCSGSTQCTVTIPANLVTAGVTTAITVTNPGPPARTSNAALFTVGASLSQLALIETDIAVGNGPQSVAAADFNGDGKQDLAVANSSDNTVSILLGKGDGTFTLACSPSTTACPATGTSPVWVVAADFNNDGKQDLAVVNSVSSTVSILLGNGDGTFQAKIDAATGTSPVSVAAGDFNGDGNLDLAIANSGSDTVSILLGNGDGTFQAKKDVSLAAGAGPSALAVADLDKDGVLDIVVADKSSSKISVLIGNGDGTFKPHVEYPADKLPTSVVVADFNNNGTPDVVVVDSGATKLSYFEGLGDGTFLAATSVDLTSGSGPSQAVAVDLNEDGKPDLAITGATANTISILPGVGDGTFGSPLSFNTAAGPTGIAVGDFNGDGRLDLVTANSTAGSVSVELQGPSVSFSSPSIGFGNQTVGITSAAQSVTLTNSGSTTLNIQSMAITGTNVSDFALSSGSNPCGSTLAATSTCTISATFTPTAAGARSAQVSVTDNASGSPQTVALTGTGTQAAVTLSCPPTNPCLSYLSLDVGQKSVAQTVTVTNSGTDTLTFSSISISGTNPADFSQSNDCLAPPSNLAAGSSCHVSVTFQPMATGNRTATVSINDNAPSSPQTISLTGTGVIPTATLSPTSLTFSSQLIKTSSATQTVTVTNSGSGPLLISGIAITGTNSGDFTQTNTCGTQLGGGGASCTVTVTFTPTAAGSRTANLTITDNNNGKNPNYDVVTLTGVGVAPMATLSSSKVDFGSQAVGSTSSAMAVTLTNNGSGALTITSTVVSGDFAQMNTCGTSVAAGANCTITITFTPTKAGSLTGTITITDNNNGVSGNKDVINLTGTGTSPTVTLLPATLSFGNQVVGTTSAGQSVTLTNTSQSADTILTIQAQPTDNFAETDTCSKAANGLAAGANCTISITFKPTIAGPYSGTLTVTDVEPTPHIVTLSRTGSDFALSVTPASATATAGTSSTFSVQVTPSGGFNQTVTLNCTGLPQLSTCAFSPASVTLDGTNAASVALTVSTTAPSFLAPVDFHRRPPNSWPIRLPLLAPLRWMGRVWLFLVWLMAMGIFIGRQLRTPRRVKLAFSLASLVFLLAGVIALPACGGGGGTPLPHPGTPTGTYNISISGGSGNISHSTTVTLTVD